MRMWRFVCNFILSILRLLSYSMLVGFYFCAACICSPPICALERSMEINLVLFCAQDRKLILGNHLLSCVCFPSAAH